MEKIPGIISQRKEKNEALAKDIPQLQELAGKVWKKEDELKQLKSELSALDRKIQLELAPPTPVCEGQEKKQDLDTFKLETIHTVNPNKDFICIRPENGIIKEEKFRRMAATQMSGRHKYFSSSYFGSIVSCLLYTTLNEIIIFD